MDEQLRKRLEEAAEKYQEEYETTERVAFTHGAVWMFKECGGMTVLHDMRRLILAQCKEWLEKKTRFAKAQYCNCEDSEDEYYNGKVDGLEAALADFENDMNKLWEEKK